MSRPTKRNATQLAYTAIRIEGGLIPAEELNRLTTLSTPEATEQTEAHYDIPRGLKLRDEIARAFKIAQGLWHTFQQQRARQDAHPQDVTEFGWLLHLCRHVLGMGDLKAVGHMATASTSAKTYQVGHSTLNGRLPVVMAAYNQPLDQPAERFGDTNPDTGRTRKRSPYMLAQEAFNASNDALWAIVTNGLKLRILRDNPSLTRPAYIEVDLEAIFTEDLYADFTAFWLLAHATRFGKTLPNGSVTDPTDCPWERWRNNGQKSGETVRANLRFQVENALRSLGTGFLSHPANTALRAQLQDPDTSSATKQAFFEELLSLVYRFIFLATVEDRTDPSTGRSLIFTPEANEEQQQRYWQGYSLTWLRERAVRRSAHDTHSDLWQALSITLHGLATGQAALGLPALGGLFADEQCPLLNTAHIDNRHLLAAVFQLGYFRQSTGLTRVNYRDMGAEELGSVYESLLELVPDYQHLSQPHAARLAFVGDDDDASNKGNARKLTGSYYTPDSLVQELIKSALEPVIAQTVQAHPADPVRALLQLTVCDPACGSGHFLLAAARRLADEVAQLRAVAQGGAPTPADYRHALRDVVGHCIYGVDKNPMAIALAKTALWLEAYTPDRPLTFIDHHLQVGDALLGVLDPKILERGIPDEAYAVLSGDDKATAAALKKQNKAELKSWKQAQANDLFATSTLVQQANAVEHLADDTLDGIAAKRQAWTNANHQAAQSTLAQLADTYVAAFLAPKVPQGEEYIPLSGYLWGLMYPNSNQPPKPELAQAAHDLCHTHSVFHWWLAFPHIADKGGFSVMLGNPPWERIKLQEEEFFATRSPLVASAKNKAERSQRIEWLRQGVLLHNLYPDVEAAEGLSPPNRAEMRLYEDFIAARRGAEAASLYAHDSGRYPLTGVGDVNTYALFAESLFQLTAPQGRAGFIVPTGIATDDSTKAYFEEIASKQRLVQMISFENEEFIFPAVHHSFRFSLLTLGATEKTEFLFFARRVSNISDSYRRFTLTPGEFRLINPNTRTCPVFRSQRDAELTKKLYRAAPVLIREAEMAGEGKDAHTIQPEVNPWGITFQRMLDMSNDSHLFADTPYPNEPLASSPHTARRLPLYEAKMIHQFDHRWATYVDNPDKPNGLDTNDTTATQKADPTFTVRPRYWVDEREVLARIARVPNRVSNAWLAFKNATDAALSDDANDDSLTTLAQCRTALTLALASWVAGALLRQHVTHAIATHPAPLPATSNPGFDLFADTSAPATSSLATVTTPDTVATRISHWSAAQAVQATETTERLLAQHYPPLAESLKADGTTGKKALPLFQKWALQDDPAQGLGLSADELAELAQHCQLHTPSPATTAPSSLKLNFLDTWMDRRSPKWLMGWRNIARSTDERSFISAVMPRIAVGHSMPLWFFEQSPALAAAFLANMSTLVYDYVVRQKLGGTNMTFGYYKQFPVLPPDCYTPADLAYIVPRVLELTHTAHDMQAWANDLLAALPSADPRPPEQQGSPLPPFPWNPERRAQLRAELDAYYARLYGLTRDELRYILDPAEVMGADYPSETFRVLKNSEIRTFGEYRTQRLVLAAWDQLASLSPSTHAVDVTYSEHGMIRNAEEGRLAGLVTVMVSERTEGSSLVEIQSAIAGLMTATHYLDSVDSSRFDALRGSLGIADVASLLSRILPIIHRLEVVGVLTRSLRGDEPLFARGSATLPREVIVLPEHTDAARLLWLAEQRKALQVAQGVMAHEGIKATGT